MVQGMDRPTTGAAVDIEPADGLSGRTARADHLKTKVSWLYYIEGRSQDAIAQIVGINRSRVLRILAMARMDGSVQVTVTARLARCRALEEELTRTYGLGSAIVVPSPHNPDDITPIIGRQLGAYLSARIRPGMTVGLGWGSTLVASLPSVERRPPDGVSVISMLGGLTKVDSVNPSDFAWRFADRLSAECYMIAAPVFAPDAESRRSLMAHSGIAEVVERARKIDLAVLSVGEWLTDSLFGRYGLLDRDEIASLKRAGAVGDVLCRFIDAGGRVIDHPVNARVLSIHPTDLNGVPEIVLASGGTSKTEAIRAALALLSPSVLITDAAVAERLVAPQKAE